jgi:hypothetical protein
MQSDAIMNTLESQSSFAWHNLHDKNLQKVNNALGDKLISNTYAFYSCYNSGTNNPTNTDGLMTDLYSIQSLTGLRLELLNIPDSVTMDDTRVIPTSVVGLNMDNIGVYGLGTMGVERVEYTRKYYNFYMPLIENRFYCNGLFNTLTINIYVLPEVDIFTVDKKIDLAQFKDIDIANVNVTVTTHLVDDAWEITDITLSSSIYKGGATALTWGSRLSQFETTQSGIQTEDDDPENPYGDPGNSSEGGGDGGYGDPDSVDPAEIPSLPSINVCDLGLITMYNPTQSQCKALSNFLWSGLFDPATYKKLFSDPMEGIIGLAIVPVSPSIAGSKNVQIGNIDSGVSMSYLSSNWKEVDCGWCDIEKYVGCFMDADPYTKISIYLPFIGIRQLAADDVNGGSIHVVYHVDVLTGACACFIQHNTRGVLYTFNGSCITNVPLTSINFSGAIQNAVSAVISGIGTLAGMSTGAAPVSAMGAMGLLNSASNAALNSKPSIQRSGNLGGSAGILSILKPYVIIERPDISVPYKVQNFTGQTCNITYYLSALSGFTMCEYVHIENCSGTSEEVAEIESLLKQGVYL